MHKKQSRSFHVAGSEGDISWSDSKDELSIKFFNEKEEIKNDNQIIPNDEMFYNQAKKFLDDWDKFDTIKSLNSASSSLAIVEAAKKSIKSGKKWKNTPFKDSIITYNRLLRIPERKIKGLTKSEQIQCV